MAITSEVKSFCRVCWAYCGTKVTVEDNKVVKVRGDKEDPLSRGYTCFKGIQAPEQHNGSGRLLRPLHRVNGELVPVESQTALREAGQQLAAIVEKHGPGAVGFYTGTQSYVISLNAELIFQFCAALKTPRNFVTMTIDQSSKWVTEQRLGTWGAGPQDLFQSDVWLVVGNNSLVSMSIAGGSDAFVLSDPVKSIKEAKARGLKLIVVDPRRSEIAEFADLHIQPRASADAEIMAAILHVILREEWYDKEFCRNYVEGLEQLKFVLEPFTPARCAEAAGITAVEIERAAAMFARDAASGMAGGATGPAMGRHSNLTEHLMGLLNVVCGRFPREGELVSHPGVLSTKAPIAQVNLPAQREWETSPKTYSHQSGMIKGTTVSTDLADEILYPGKEKLRALICVGGNPAVALPDQAKAEKALQSLELLIVIDPRMSATARFADYVFPPKLQYERPDHTGTLEVLHTKPYAHITPAIVPPPANSDLVEDWYVLWSLARSLGIQLQLRGQNISMDKAPRIENLQDIQMLGGRTSAAEVKSRNGGAFYPGGPVRVGPRQNQTRFQAVPNDVKTEINDLASELKSRKPSDNVDNVFQLIVRRHRETMNSTAADFEATWKRMPGNPAYFNQADLSKLGLKTGTMIDIVRGEARIKARVALDNGVRPGIVSVGHCRPGLASNPWEATNALVDSENDLQSINRMPVMTGMYVQIVPQ